MNLKTVTLATTLAPLSPLVVTASPAPAYDNYPVQHPIISSSDTETLTKIFGHRPSTKEQSDYISTYGKIPSKAEVDAYIKASMADPEEPDAVHGGNEYKTHSPEQTTTPYLLSPGEFSWFFRYGKWITRKKVVSLSLMPRSGGIGNEGDTRTWNTVYKTFHNHPNWSRYRKNGADESMRKQYMCHFKYGMIKTPWNLEPSRKPSDVSWLTCN